MHFLIERGFRNKVLIKHWCSAGVRGITLGLNVSNEVVKRSLLALPAAGRGFNSSLSCNDSKTFPRELDSS